MKALSYSARQNYCRLMLLDTLPLIIFSISERPRYLTSSTCLDCKPPFFHLGGKEPVKDIQVSRICQGEKRSGHAALSCPIDL